VNLEVRQAHLMYSGDNKHIANETKSRSQRVNDDDDNYLPDLRDSFTFIFYILMIIYVYIL